MMKLLGKARIDEREVFYVNVFTDAKWYEKLPDNWTGFIVSDSKEVPFISGIAEKCLDKNIGYVCCAGQSCELMHDIFDDIINERIVITKSLDENDGSMTSWHYNFSEGFWFSMYCAFDEDKQLNRIVCVDCTEKGVKKWLEELLGKINNGWLPSDEKIEEPQYDK